MKFREIIKQIVSFILCFTMLMSLVGCAVSTDKNESTTNYVKDDGTVVVDGIEINDALVELKVNELKVREAEVLDINPAEIVVQSVNVKEIQVCETEVVSLNDEFVYLAYQNFVSYYDEDIDWEKFIKDVAIGSTVIIVCVTLSTVGGPVGTFFGAVITSEFTAASLVVGAAIDAAIDCYIAYNDGGDFSYVLGHMLNGVADGFKWSAILAPLTGSVSGIKALKAVKALKKIPKFEKYTDKELVELLKKFNKIAKEAAKNGTKAAKDEMTEDAIRKLYKELSSELSEEITEELFILAYQNSDDILKIVTKFNPFDTARGVQKAVREQFLKNTDVSDDVVQDLLKKISNKSIKKLDDITDETLRNYIKNNMPKFIELFGNSLSKEFIEECLLEKLGKETLEVIRELIASKEDVYVELVKRLGKESVDKILGDADTLVLMQCRYGTKNVVRLNTFKKMYDCILKSPSGNKVVEFADAESIMQKILDGSISSLDDVTKINSTASANIYRSIEIFGDALKNVEMDKKAAGFLDDIVAARIENVIDLASFPDNALDQIVMNKMTKNQIIENFGEEAYSELMSNADQTIAALSMQSSLNKSLIEEVFTDSLNKSGISDDVIRSIKAGASIKELGLEDEIILSIDNSLAQYYRAVDEDCFWNYIDDIQDIRSAKAAEYYRMTGTMPNNGQYAGFIMPTDNSFIKAKYGDIYMNQAGFVVFDRYAIARVEIADLTGNETLDIAKANLLHHGTQVDVPGYTWHHCEDGKTLILVPTELHDAYRHTGGAALIRAGIF